MKIRTTGPSFYIVRPNGIKIKPGELSLFEITLREKSKACVLLDLTVAAINVDISVNRSVITVVKSNQKKLHQDRTCAIN